MDQGTLFSLEGVLFCLNRLCGSGFEVAIKKKKKKEREREILSVYNKINRQMNKQRDWSPEATLITGDCSISELTHFRVQRTVMGVQRQVKRRQWF